MRCDGDRSRAGLAAAAGLVVALAVQGTPAGAQVEPADESGAASFLRDYRARLPALFERYSTNRKIRYRLTEYVHQPEGGQRMGAVASNGVRELVTDGRRIKVVPVDGPGGGGREVHRFWRPDVQFLVMRGDDGRFDLSIPGPRVYERSHFHEEARYGYFAHEPLRAGGNCLATSHWFEDDAPSNAIITVEEVHETTWNGRPCVKVVARWDNRLGTIETGRTYLDPDRDLVTIGTESDWRIDPLTEARYRQIDEIDYRPSDEGFPLPKSSRRLFRFEDGSTRRVHDVEFLAYERHVARREEFLLEENYRLGTPRVFPLTEGLGRAPFLAAPDPPPDPEPGPRIPLRNARRGAVVAGVVGLAVAVTLLVRRTTRRPVRS